MIKAGIVGGAGFTAGELIRILLNHPEVEMISVQSRSHAGKPLQAAHPDLEGETKLHFSESLSSLVDVVFLCSGHGSSKELLKSNDLPAKGKIIDLSADFRIKDPSHDFVYGLPELNREAIRSATRVANPGCFATCIQLCLLPLASSGLLKNEVHLNAITGSTGAGQLPTETTHFSWRSNNASLYKPFTHQHIGEIRQSLQQLQPGFSNELYFIPMRGAFTRGVLAACYLKVNESFEELNLLYQSFYESHPFVLVSSTRPDVKRVVNTNKAVLHLDMKGNVLLITGVIDNLMKGASAQAVQNMNLMFGMNERSGLNLKPSVF